MAGRRGRLVHRQRPLPLGTTTPGRPGSTPGPAGGSPPRGPIRPQCTSRSSGSRPPFTDDPEAFAMSHPSRRTFVLGGLAAAGAVLAAARERPAAVPYPFKLGVASGEPDADSVVLWTRLAPSPLNADGQGGMANADVAVDWQVVDDRRVHLAGRVRHGDRPLRRRALGARRRRRARRRTPSTTTGSGRRATSRRSAAPAPRRRPARVGRDLVMAFASCAHYESGYFTAYRRMAEDRPGPDPAPRRLHLRGRRRRPAAVRAAPRRRDRVAGRLPPPVRAVQVRPGPAGRARRRAVAGGARRPRGGEQLRRPACAPTAARR